MTLMLVMPMSILGIGSANLSFPIILLLFIFNFIKSNPRFLSREIILSIFIYLVFLVFVALVPLIHGTNSFDLLVFICYGFFIFISSVLLLVCYRSHYKDGYQYVVLRHLYLIGSLNAVIAVLVLLSPELKQIVYSIVDTNETTEEYLALGMRSSGLFVFGGSIMSLFHCLIVYIGLVHVKYKLSHTNAKFIITDMILIVFNISAIFLSGRMGFIIILATLSLILILPARVTRVSKLFVIKVLALSISLLACLVLFYYESFKNLIDWALELFINILMRNEIGTASSDVLKSMYRFPSDMVFGEGIFSMLGLGIDSGYVLLIWYFGVLGVLSFLLMLFLNFLILLQSHKNKDVFSVYLFSLFLILIGNFKDIYLFGSSGIAQIYFISMLLCLFNVNDIKLKYNAITKK
ncbi:hypothetical protein [Aeromonas sp. 6P]|uniref:hypothetical protein n=2 Tax=unclassified Aeromonas TaxID=257493 RepID=UPI003F7A71CC